MSVKMLTVEDCQSRMEESEKEYHAATCEKAETFALSKLTVWKRILWHISKGDTITIDEEENVQLWPKEASA